MDGLGKAGVAVVETGWAGSWGSEIPALLRVLDGQFGTTNYREVGPLKKGEAQHLRARLLDASPRLASLASLTARSLNGNCAALVPSVGLVALAENTRALVAYALAVAFGNPTATDSSQVIWDVKARGQQNSTYFSTFSETDREAAYHTDSQYAATPEDTFILYCMTPAGCGGGVSSICDARALRSNIERSSPWVLEVLQTHALPFRVPTAFMQSEHPEDVEATLAPIFATDPTREPLIRYRQDTLVEGIEYFPEYVNADAHRAIDAFQSALRTSPHQASFDMPRDSLIICNNHHALHARTEFQDQARHFLRIRLHSDGLDSFAKSRYRLLSKRVAAAARLHK